MSTGTNKERLEQNNIKLEEIKTQIQNLPEKVDYKYGEKFVTNGLVVTSENLSGTVTEITDYSLNIKDGQELQLIHL